MKKLKELLVFVIPFVLLSVLSVIYFALHTQNSGFMGGIQYVRLLWKDELFCKAFINTYMKPLAFSCLFVMVFTIIYYLIKHKVMIPMPVYRLCSMVIGSAVAFPLIIFGKAIAFGMPGELYSTQTIVSTTPPSLWESITVTDIVFSLQTGIFAAFLFWLAELIWGLAKKLFGRKKKYEDF